MAFKDRLLVARLAAKLTQVQLAKKLGVSDKGVSQWERGESQPEFGKLLPIARALRTTISYLMDEKAGLSDIDEQIFSRLGTMTLDEKKRALRLLDALDGSSE